MGLLGLERINGGLQVLKGALVPTRFQCNCNSKMILEVSQRTILVFLKLKGQDDA